LEKLIEQKRRSGVYLTVLGFGDGNYQDKKMETLADKGNGNYSYIDNLQEAKKTLVKEMNATLQTVAKDVKFQLRFNPNVVATCRLVGYENRVLENKDFENDNKDAGEMGEGHTVTAFYELQLVENADTNAELVKVRTRYKLPKKIRSTLYEISVLANTYRPFAQSSENFRFAASVAGFGMCLRESEFKAPAFDFEKVLSIAKTAIQTDAEGYKENFIELVEDALP
jgi:Ca-activated chloride channel homolog